MSKTTLDTPLGNLKKPVGFYSKNNVSAIGTHLDRSNMKKWYRKICFCPQRAASAFFNEKHGHVYFVLHFFRIATETFGFHDL